MGGWGRGVSRKEKEKKEKEGGTREVERGDWGIKDSDRRIQKTRVNRRAGGRPDFLREKVGRKKIQWR